MADLKPNLQFPFALQCQLSWSKNITEERALLLQILLGSNDHRYCILLGLALYLELWISSGEGLRSSYVFVGLNETPEQVNRACYSAMRTYAFEADNFQRSGHDAGPIGTHSLRKLPATHARYNNCTQDEIEVRGQWHVQGNRVSMRYVSTTLPYQDAKVASKLCIGGPVKYAVRDGSNVTDDWLIQYVVPNIVQHFPMHFAVMLALPLLWACYDDECSIPIPDFLWNQVRAAYEANCDANFPVRQNLIEKHWLVVINDNGTLQLHESG